MLRAPPPITSTGAPGRSSSAGATVRQPSTTLSLTLATLTGSRPSGTGTSMASANGTRSTSDSAPPQSPPTTPKPYMEWGGTDSQLPVSPRRQAPQSPQEIWNGTDTTSPTRAPVTWSPTSTTSATHSCPRAIGPGSAPRRG